MSVEEKPPVVVGEVLSNGGIVLAYKWRPHTGGEAEGQHGVILCLLAENYHPFVVWSFVKQTDGKMTFFTGDYWQKLDAAVISYKIRAKRI